MKNENLITDPIISAQAPHKYLGILGMIWVSVYMIATFTAIKTFAVGSLVFSVGILTYPLVYIFNDIYTEVYGYRVTRKIVWTGFACFFLASVIAYLYSVVPPSASFPNEEAFDLIFKASPLMALGAVIANFSGEITNSYVVAKLKVITEGKYEWVRLVASTFFGQLVDNTLFFTTIFLAAGWYAAPELFQLVVGSVVFCTLWEIVALPLTRRVIRFLKHKEGLDTYDHGTNFNPFALKK